MPKTKTREEIIREIQVLARFTEEDLMLMTEIMGEAACKGKGKKLKLRQNLLARIFDIIDLAFNLPICTTEGLERYTISTQAFKSLEEAEAKIREWYEDDDLREGTKVFEITGVTYKPELRLVKEVKTYGR